jgi:IclR family transcriptional regulator, acetate operon repressor
LTPVRGRARLSCHVTKISCPETRIQSVDRAAQLLLLLARAGEGVSVTAAARELALAVPTAHHLLATLAANGLAAQDRRRRYLLGPAAAVLADGFARQGAGDHLLSPLRTLAERTGETAYLAAWGAGGEIRALASVQGANPVRVAEVERGPYRDAHARASGKLLLAYARPEQRDAYLAAQPLRACTGRTITDPAALDAELEAIRRRGFAEDREEYVEGVACVSAPALHESLLLAAYTVSAPVYGYTRRRATLRAAVLAAAAAATEPERRAA